MPNSQPSNSTVPPEFQDCMLWPLASRLVPGRGPFLMRMNRESPLWPPESSGPPLPSWMSCSRTLWRLLNANAIGAPPPLTGSESRSPTANRALVPLGATRLSVRLAASTTFKSL